MAVSDDLCTLLAAQFPALAAPSAALLARLAPLLRVRRLAAGATLLAQGAPTPALWGVLAGRVEVRLGMVDGASSVVDQIPPGRLFGLASFVTGLPSSYEALAREPTRVLAMGPAAYGLLMDEHPGFARALLAEFALRHHSTMQMLGAARHQGPLARLTLALAQLRSAPASGPALAAPVGGPPPGWCPVRVTQAELAALCGLSRQTVNSLLGTLVQQGRLQRVYGGLWLPPP